MALKHINLKDHEYKDIPSCRIAYAGEDGVFEAIFAKIGVLNKFFVDIGCRDPEDPYDHSNTCYLWKKLGWNGLLLDKSDAQDHPLVTHELVTPKNVIDIFRKYGVPQKFDLLDIDIDGYGYCIWEAMEDSQYRSRVVCIEFNNLMPVWPISGLIGEARWLYPNDIGGISNYSLSAIYQLGLVKGYELVHTIRNNAIFVSAELSGPFKIYTLKTLSKTKRKYYRKTHAETESINRPEVTACIGKIN